MASEQTTPSRPAAAPLSPHLQVWRWHPTMATSILHRASGVANYAGAFVVVFWLMALALGPDAYAAAEGLLLSPLGRVVLFGFTLSVVYHLLNGVRHLVWDAGKGFSPGVANAVSVLILIAAAGLSVGIWLAAYAV